ncbi:MAG TPA: YajQ family cyclic di-GMP-binding protein [bacterium]|nr:YajQ family cyclic di-GMP-binding protein [bacterium]
MAQTFSFDITSKVKMDEVHNAVNQTLKELSQRFDFKGTKSEVNLNQKDHTITIVADDELKLKNIIEILKLRLAKREISPKALAFGKVTASFEGTVTQVVTVQSGLSSDQCKEIVKIIKEQKLKVQATIQESQVRVTGAKKDDLQSVIQTLRDKDLPYHIEFANYR